jgi:hypothetical protein
MNRMRELPKEFDAHPTNANARRQNLGERSAVSVVAGGAMIATAIQGWATRVASVSKRTIRATILVVVHRQTMHGAARAPRKNGAN